MANSGFMWGAPNYASALLTRKSPLINKTNAPKLFPPQPAAAAPAPAPAPVPTPGLPLDPAAQAAQIAAGRNLTVGTVGNQLQRGYLGFDTGYNSAGGRDYSNPYSKAALLLESYNRSQRGTANNYAASGQFHSGAYGRMQNENARNYSIGSNALQTGAQRGYTGLGLSDLGNYANYGTGVSDANWQALMRALGLGG